MNRLQPTTLWRKIGVRTWPLICSCIYQLDVYAYPHMILYGVEIPIERLFLCQGVQYSTTICKNSRANISKLTVSMRGFLWVPEEHLSSSKWLNVLALWYEQKGYFWKHGACASSDWSSRIGLQTGLATTAHPLDHLICLSTVKMISRSAAGTLFHIHLHGIDRTILGLSYA